MKKLIRPALACGAAAGVLAWLLLLPRPALKADDPLPWEEYGGHDGYYIARGWTEGYSSSPLAVRSLAGAGVTMSHTVHLPLVLTAPTPPSGLRETRALWVTRWDFKTASDIQTIVDKVAYANLNTILFQVRGQADALYTPGLEPWSAVLTSQPGDPPGATLGRDPGWDPLAELIDRAHSRGLEVQAWINVYPAWLGTTPPPKTASPQPMFYAFNYLYQDYWVQWAQGNPPTPMTLNGHYLCATPAYPAVVDRVVNVCRDLLTRYELDGLHFDYIRYADPGGTYSYDPLTEQAVAANPGLDRRDFQRAQVTALLQRVRDEAVPARPSARLTASAWPIYKDQWDWFNGPDGYSGYSQDSQGWARNGLVSGIMPMLYTTSIHDSRDRFASLANDHVTGSQPGGVIIGIAGDYASFEEIAWRIETARAAGARGQALFSYRLFDERTYWPELRNGPYQQVAVPNWP